MASIGQVCRRPFFQDLNLPPFQYNVGVDPGAVIHPGGSGEVNREKSKSIKIVSNQVIFID